MLFFSLDKNACGGLAEALNVINDHSVNLLNIRSYADLHDQGKVDFIATLKGHEAEAALAGAISELQSRLPLVKVLGSYRSESKGVFL